MHPTDIFALPSATGSRSGTPKSEGGLGILWHKRQWGLAGEVMRSGGERREGAVLELFGTVGCRFGFGGVGLRAQGHKGWGLESDCR